MNIIPKTQHAIQLIGPDQLILNPAKPVPTPGPHQILAQVQCVGLCFSDLKLLKQFSAHPRKSPVIAGLDLSILASIPSYVPNELPTVPGHEAVVRVVAVGPDVHHHHVGARYLVQTDYRALPTAHSNAAFGYNFEGALQEYVLLDERVIIDPVTLESFLIPVPDSLSASAIALIEPWACVENSYVSPQRQSINPTGQLLIVSNTSTSTLFSINHPHLTRIPPEQAQNLPNESFDDIIYFGADKKIVEILSDKLAPRGLFNIVQSGQHFNAPVLIAVGRVHYGATRWIGTPTSNPLDSYKTIPPSGELRHNDKILILGAAGPMGQMHVIRSLCTSFKNLQITAADTDDTRLSSLAQKASPLANKNNIPLRLLNPTSTSTPSTSAPQPEKYSYIALMAPIPALVATAINDSLPHCLINLFAGIPATAKQAIDLDRYIANRCYMFGTSGSVIRDMKIVLSKVQNQELDTNCSVDAISGMSGAIEGLKAVENRTLSGKIIVYPSLHTLPLTPLSALQTTLPTVAQNLHNTQWTQSAEQALLKFLISNFKSLISNL